jgi:AraC-like DNA-binding protein
VADVDIRLAFSDICGAMVDHGKDYAYERALLAVVEAAARLGITVDLSAVALTRRAIGPDMLVPVAQFQAALRCIFSDPRETLGIDLARALSVEKSGLWGFLLRSSPNFGEMLRRAERYIKLNFHYTSMNLAERGEDVAVICRHPHPSPFSRHEQEVCFFLGQWLTWGRNLIGDEVNPNQVHLRWQGPADRAPFEAFFDPSINFGAAENSLVFGRAVLNLALPEFTPELADVFEAYAAASIRRLTPEASFIDQVQEALSAGMLTASTSETAVAECLGITVRTLHRRLAALQSSFRQLQNELLRSRAEQLLREPRLPIAEVSYLLGYAEPSNFHRAFRRWVGVTPAEWRSQELARISS